MVTLSPTGASVPTTLNRFFEKLNSQQTPALIWYSANGERIELSGRVLMNWIDKSANLLVEECELEPGEGFDLQAPLHWRTIVLGLAALRVGALLEQDEPLVAAVCTEQEAGYTNDPAYLLAVDRAPLALSYTGNLQLRTPTRCSITALWCVASATSTRVCFPMIRQKSLRVSAMRKPTGRLSFRHRPIVRRAIRYLRGSVRSLWS